MNFKALETASSLLYPTGTAWYRSFIRKGHFSQQFPEPQAKLLPNSQPHICNMSEQANRCAAAFEDLQDDICTHLEQLDGLGRFKEDIWERPGGGGGRSRTITGELIEKGGVGFSDVHGLLGEAAARALGVGPGVFRATGVSIVLHPRPPHATRPSIQKESA